MGKKALTFLLSMAVVLPLAASSANARDSEFDTVVKHVEKQYNARQTHVPFLWLGRAVIRVVKPAGIKSAKLALFENQDFYNHTGPDESDSVFRKALDHNWKPLLRVNSKRNGYWTYVYSRQEGNDLKLMLATLERNSAVVLRIKLDPDKLAQFLEQPEIFGIKLATKAEKTHGNNTCDASDKSPVGNDQDGPKDKAE